MLLAYEKQNVLTLSFCAGGIPNSAEGTVSNNLLPDLMVNVDTGLLNIESRLCLLCALPGARTA